MMLKDIDNEECVGGICFRLCEGGKKIIFILAITSPSSLGGGGTFDNGLMV